MSNGKRKGKPLSRWIEKLCRAWSEDAKNALHTALHVISVFDVSYGIAFYQDSSFSKGKEAKVARNMIDAMALDNAVLTLGTLYC